MPIANFVVRVMVVSAVLCVVAVAGMRIVGSALRLQEITVAYDCFDFRNWIRTWFIYQVDVDTRVIATTGISLTDSVGELTWSPNGNRLAFRLGNDPNLLTELYVWDETNRSLEALNVQGRSPAWSPDSSQLAFLTWAGDNHNLNVLNLLTRQLIVIPLPEPFTRNIAWHPNGREIFFLGHTANGSAVQSVEISSGDIAWISTGNGVFFTQLQWSLNSQTLALSDENINLYLADDLEPSDENTTLYLADDLAANIRLFPVGRSVIYDFSWSPQESKIAFADANTGFYILDVSSGQTQYLFGTNPLRQCDNPHFESVAWRP